MNAINAMKALQKELQNVFNGYRLNNSEEEISFYLWEPPRTIGETEESVLKPYQMIRLLNGSQKDEESSVSMMIVIVVPNEDEDQQAWQDVVNQIDRIRLRFLRDHIFGGKYEVTELSWLMADDNPYPVYLGGVELTVEVPFIHTEEGIYD